MEGYQKKKARYGLNLARRVSPHGEREVSKHDSHHGRHGSGADKENVSVLELSGWPKLEDEAVIYPGLPPHEDVAPIEEQMQEQKAEHAATGEKHNKS